MTWAHFFLIAGGILIFNAGILFGGFLRYRRKVSRIDRERRRFNETHTRTNRMDRPRRKGQ